MKPCKIVFLLLLFFYALAPARAARKKEISPTLTTIDVEQAGDTQIFLTLEGALLPRPEILYESEKELKLLLPDVKFPALRHEREGRVPLVPRITAEQGDGGAVLTLLCEQPLELRRISGVGSSRIRVHLSTSSPIEQKNENLILTERRTSSLSTKKVTLNMKDCDLSDVFRVLGATAGVNIVVDSSVSNRARLTLSFHDAPFDEVLGYILRSQNLESQKIGGTVVIGAKNSLAMLSGRLLTKSYRLAYADPQKTSPLLKEMAELSLSANKVIVDERQNTIIVVATAQQHERVRSSLEILDAPLRQVALTARIIEVTEDASDELETAINAVYDWWWGSYQSGELSTGAAHVRQNSSDSTGLPNLDTSNNLPGSIGSGVVDLAGTATRMLDVRLRAIVEKKQAKIVADPKVTVYDGGKATVKTVDKLKYVSRRDDANNPTYDDEEVGPSLEVTPRIGRDGVITINVVLSTGEVVEWKRGGQGEEIPQTNSRSVTTTVNVRDGEPFVIGGLYKDTKTRTVSGVPVIQNIPLLGKLFQSRSVKTTRSQVVMVVIPCIIDVVEGARPQPEKTP